MLKIETLANAGISKACVIRKGMISYFIMWLTTPTKEL